MLRSEWDASVLHGLDLNFIGPTLFIIYCMSRVTINWCYYTTPPIKKSLAQPFGSLVYHASNAASLGARVPTTATLC